ncbi:unnamed protein product [Calypogeia fissa]
MAMKRSTSCDRTMKYLRILILKAMMLVMAYLMQPGLVMVAEGLEEPPKSNLATIEMKVHNLYPEGFDWDAKHKRFLVGSMGQGKLVSVTEDGTVEDFVKDEEYAGAIILGVTVDRFHNRVLAVVHKPTSPNRINALAAYDLDSKKRLFFVNLHEVVDDSARSTNKDVANDVAVDADGNAYVTNSGGNLIWKVTKEGVKSVFIASVPQLPIVVEDEFVKTVTINGIVVHHDGYLLLSQSNSGGLLRVGIADKEVQAVKIMDGNHEAVLDGADGMAMRSDVSLVVVSTHTAWLLSTTNSWLSATLVGKVPLDTAVSTTGVTAKDMDMFAIQCHFVEFWKGMEWDSFKILEVKFTADDSEDNNPLWLLAIAGIALWFILLWKCQMNQFNKVYTKKRV